MNGKSIKFGGESSAPPNSLLGRMLERRKVQNDSNISDEISDEKGSRRKRPRKAEEAFPPAKARKRTLCVECGKDFLCDLPGKHVRVQCGNGTRGQGARLGREVEAAVSCVIASCLGGGMLGVDGNELRSHGRLPTVLIILIAYYDFASGSFTKHSRNCGSVS